MAKISCVLFDLDGTLLDTNDLIYKSFKHLFEKHVDRPFTDEDFYKYYGIPLKDSLKLIDEDNFDQLLETYKYYNLKYHDDLTKIYPGVYETLEILNKNNIPMAVVTSKLKNTALKGLKLFNLDNFIQACIAVEDVEKHKPDPEPILKALEILKQPKEGAIMVGDSSFDIESAKRAGVKSALVRWSIHPEIKKGEIKPDYTLDSMTDLLKIMNLI